MHLNLFLNSDLRITPGMEEWNTTSCQWKHFYIGCCTDRVNLSTGINSRCWTLCFEKIKWNLNRQIKINFGVDKNKGELVCRINDWLFASFTLLLFPACTHTHTQRTGGGHSHRREHSDKSHLKQTSSYLDQKIDLSLFAKGIWKGERKWRKSCFLLSTS